MERIFFIIIYSIIAIVMLYMITLRLKKNRFPGAYNGFMIGSLIYYSIIPLILWVGANVFIENSSNWRYMEINEFIFGKDIAFRDVVRAIISLFIGLFGFEVGYSMKRHYRYDKCENDKKSIFNERFFKVLKIIAYSTLPIGAVSILLYISAFGGLSNALDLAEILRQHDSSITDYGIAGGYSYFLVISGVLTVSPLLCYFLWTYDKKKKYLILLFISIIMAGAYLLINSGKSAILRLAIIFLYMFLHNRNVKHKSFWFVGAVIIGLPIMSVMDAVFARENLLDALEDFSYLDKMRDFAAPTELNYNMARIVERYDYMYFKHLITDFIDVLPGISFKASSVNTSEFIKGVNWMQRGGVPNDVLTYGFLQLREIGVILIFFLWGLISGWIDNMLARIESGKGKRLISMLVCMNMVSLVACADISSTILYNLSFIMSVVILSLYVKRAKRIDRRESIENE